MPTLNQYVHQPEIQYLSDAPSKFEGLYLQLREKEHRIYTDEALQALPISPNLYPEEWALRQESLEHLRSYLKAKKPAHILEIGCGNAWLSRQLADALEAEVFALDKNQQELEQAQRVFQNKNLKLLYADIFDTQVQPFLQYKFDIIIFAASVHYFSDFKRLIQQCQTFLKPKGEIHILDSCFYKTSELVGARHRSLTYFQEMGFPEMQAFYYHHSWEVLKAFSYQVLYKPSIAQKWLKGRKNPFPWIKINKD